MLLRREIDVCALREIKLKGKGEVMFGEVVIMVPAVKGERAKECVALILNNCLLR